MWLGPSAATGDLGWATMVGFATHIGTRLLMGLVGVPFISALPSWRMMLAALAYALASYPVVVAAVMTWANPHCKSTAAAGREAGASGEMSMRHVLFFTISIAVIVSGCSRDPGRDVKPMANPLQAEPSSEAASSEVIPLEKVRKSQAAAVSQRVANTEITVTYSRPVARGRDLFGGLVRHGEVWNPGADQATAIGVTRDVHVNDRPLRAGKYSLWAVPRPDTWTMVFSGAADVYHTPYPGEAHDVMRVEVAPERGPHMEVLTFYFPHVDGKDAVLRLHWGEVMVPLSFRVP